MAASGSKFPMISQVQTMVDAVFPFIDNIGFMLQHMENSFQSHTESMA